MSSSEIRLPTIDLSLEHRSKPLSVRHESTQDWSPPNLPSLSCSGPIPGRSSQEIPINNQLPTVLRLNNIDAVTAALSHFPTGQHMSFACPQDTPSSVGQNWAPHPGMLGQDNVPVIKYPDWMTIPHKSEENIPIISTEQYHPTSGYQFYYRDLEEQVQCKKKHFVRRDSIPEHRTETIPVGGKGRAQERYVSELAGEFDARLNWARPQSQHNK